MKICSPFLTFTAVSGDTFHWGKQHRHLLMHIESLEIPSLMRKKELLDRFHCYRFCCRLSLMQQWWLLFCLPQWSRFIYKTATYCICIRMFVNYILEKEEVIAINIML